MSPRLEKRRATGRHDASAMLARTLITRGLRRGGAHHVLLGYPGIVGFIVPEADAEIYVSVARDMLKRHRVSFDPDDFDVVRWTGEAPKSGGRSADETLKLLLPKAERIFGVASKESDIPGTFRLVADAIVEVAPVDVPALRGVFAALFGRIPPDHDLAPAIGAPLPLLGAAIKRGRNTGWALRRLRGFLAVTSAPRPAPEKSDFGPTLSDLHGYGEAAEWGHALAIDLADYQAGKITWGEVDRGIVLSGAPGVGKTIYATALARTCNVPIYVHSLARWQARGYLNDLLKAMLAAFAEAKKHAPCILFLDELDSFGDRENLNDRNAQYVREVINGFLECLDGVEGREGVVVVGATNWPERIDPAILRPGRLDRHIRIPLPDATARAGILRHHLRDALPEADLPEIAERLDGSTGAVIEQIVRDARRKARSERRALVVEDLLASLPARVRLTDATYQRACVHEAGHAVVGYVLRGVSGSTPVQVRIFREVAIGGQGGQTDFGHSPGGERTEAFHLAQITTLLAGLAAEQIVLGEHADGGGGGEQSDLHLATVLAASMETSLGLGTSLTYRSSNRPAEVMASVRADPVLRRRVGARLDACLRRARDILDEHRSGLNELAAALALRGSVTLEDITRFVGEEIAGADRDNCSDDVNPSASMSAGPGR